MRRLLSFREAPASVLLVLALAVGAALSPNFQPGYLLSSSSDYVETGLVALAMTLIIVAGKIDLSVASMLALTACVTGTLFSKLGLPMPAALVFAPLFGALLGLFNGGMIVKLRLPPLTVTLGTLALYRGVAQILLGDSSISGFPHWFTGIDFRGVGPFPAPLLIFLILAVVFLVLLHRTPFGRWTVAIGTNEQAARYSGVPVGRVVVLLFVLSGLMAGLGSLLMTSRLSVARFDMATGLELEAITAVVLGGTDIFGGKGSIFGTVVALALIGVLREAMGLANLQAETRLLVIGALLVLSIAVPNLVRRRRR